MATLEQQVSARPHWKDLLPRPHWKSLLPPLGLNPRSVEEHPYSSIFEEGTCKADIKGKPGYVLQEGPSGKRRWMKVGEAEEKAVQGDVVEDEPKANPSKKERLEEYFRRLQNAPAAATFDEARSLLDNTLIQVENDLTDIPYDPGWSDTDGRMYPPQDDSIRNTQNPKVTRLRTRRHNAFVGKNGAIEIRDAPEYGGSILLSKLGTDGKGVWEQ